MTYVPAYRKISNSAGPSVSAKVRSNISYPVIDSDLHTIEFAPIFEDYVDKIGGPKAVDDFRAAATSGWYKLTEEQRRSRRALRPPFWNRPSENTLDLATVSLPRLLHERLGDQGTDFAVLYPNLATFAVGLGKPELRRILVRAVNTYHADTYRPYADRLTPVAAIPLHTPTEGIEELEFAIKELGLKVGLIPGGLRRPIEDLSKKYPAKDHPQLAGHIRWLDTFGLESLYDYDPFWAKAVELKVPLTTHSSGQGWTSRSSYSNFMYNHIGHFADAAHAFAKSLVIGGVTYRFPELRIGMLEGGAGYAANLYADLLGHWEKRNGKALQKFNPARANIPLLNEFYQEYADEKTLARIGSVDELAQVAFGFDARRSVVEQSNELDDFAAAHIETPEDLRDRFIPNFFFGAEADDPSVAHAFNTKVNPLGAEINAIWGSDSGHWDVPDLTQVLSDTWRLVEQGAISEDNFRSIVFANPHKFYSEANPDFFKGTAVEEALQSRRVAAE